MLAASGRGVDAFSYHFYGTVSKRCAGTQSAENALSDEWLMRTVRDEAFYAALRDRFEPGRPMWLTETGETACGGNPWASTFVDTFRYLNQLGVLAKKGVQVVTHNTLAASDYGVIDEETLTPRPNYWSAVLWHRLMGTTVLDAGAAAPGVYLYAHCLRDQPGGVAVLAITTDRNERRLVAIGSPILYRLTSNDLMGRVIALNGRELETGAGGTLPEMKGEQSPWGELTLAPLSITFLVFPNAGNDSCW
jgi:hypothetical protein